MSDHNVAQTQGAVDLSTFAAAASVADDESQSAATTTVPGPLIQEVSEASLQEIMAMSQTVPVVLVFYSGRSLSSMKAVEVVEDTARQYSGAFAVGKIDADIETALTATLQIQSLPTSIALVAGRPVPMFEGVPNEQQFASLIDELIQVAPQLGVSGRVDVSDQELDKPIPAAHIAPLEAADQENWEEAIRLWKKVLANNPADQEAKLALGRAEFEHRQQKDSEGDAAGALATADQLFARGKETEAFNLLLEQIAEADEDAKEAARLRLIELFRLAVDAAAVKDARTRLATFLMM